MQAWETEDDDDRYLLRNSLKMIANTACWFTFADPPSNQIHQAVMQKIFIINFEHRKERVAVGVECSAHTLYDLCLIPGRVWIFGLSEVKLKFHASIPCHFSCKAALIPHP